MELLLVIAVVAAFVLLVKHTKAKGRIAELTLKLKARQNEIDDLERAVVRLRGDLQVQLQELQRFKPIQDVEAEAKGLRIEAEAQRDFLVQGARNRLEKAEEKLQSAVAEADRIVAMANERAQEIAGDAFAASSCIGISCVSKSTRSIRAKSSSAWNWKRYARSSKRSASRHIGAQGVVCDVVRTETVLYSALGGDGTFAEHWPMKALPGAVVTARALARGTTKQAGMAAGLNSAGVATGTTDRIILKPD